MSFQCLLVCLISNSKYLNKQNIISEMEDYAGKKTSGNTFVESPKKTINPGKSQSQWSFGWQGNSKETTSNRANNSQGFNLYHNQSSILLGEQKGGWKQEQSYKGGNMKKKEAGDRPVWNYNPKTAGKTTMVLGTQKTDYRKKDEVNKERTPTTLTQSRKK